MNWLPIVDSFRTAYVLEFLSALNGFDFKSAVDLFLPLGIHI